MKPPSTPNSKFIFLIAISLVFIAVGLFRHLITDDDFTLILANRASPEWTSMADDILRDFARASSKVGPWSINSESDDSATQIYIFDSEHMKNGLVSAFRNNCHYLGDGHRIVCDVSLIRKIVTYFDLDKKEQVTADTSSGLITRRYIVPEDGAKIKQRYKLMLTWVLGHELGHLVNKHSGKLYFEQHVFDKAVSVTSYCHKTEFEADAFLVSVYPSKDGFRDLYYFLYDLVNREIRRQACPGQSTIAYCNKIFPGTGLAIVSKPITYSVDKSHPDYILRLLRIIDIVQDREDFGILAYQARQLISNGLLKLPDPAIFGQGCTLVH